MMKQTLLPIKIRRTKEQITPMAGLLIYTELMESFKLRKSIRSLFPKPGNSLGFRAEQYLLPLFLMFLAGGRYLEDIRKISNDTVITKQFLCKIIPGADAIGNWIKKQSDIKKRALQKMHQKFCSRFLSRQSRAEHTLDIDAFSIESNKHSAHYTYKGFKGYMPMAGHLAELDLCIHYEFRKGSESPRARNLEFIKDCERRMPSGHKIIQVRIDSAGYNSDLFNYLDRKRIKFTITGVKTTTMLDEIAQFKDEDWKPLKKENGLPTGREIAEGYAMMDGTDYFRIVVQRWKNPELKLFEDVAEYCYHVICTNFSPEEKSAQQTVCFHNGRCRSERYYSEAKNGFNLEYMPCDHHDANAIWFGIGMMAYNIHIAAKRLLLPKAMHKCTISTIRYQLICIAGKITQHARTTFLNLAGICQETLDIIHKARLICWKLKVGYG
jgi:hypothetical protein